MEKLEGLALQADAIDGESAATEPSAILEQHAQGVQNQIEGENATQIKMILAMAVPVLSALYPSLKDVYSDATQEAVAQSLAPVMSKYSINLSEWGTAYKEEIGALVVCVPIAWATVQAVKEDIAQRDNAPKKAIEKVAENQGDIGQAHVVSLG